MFYDCAEQYSLWFIFSNCRWTLAYVFEPLLSQDVNEFKEWWNTHRIRRNRVSNCPHGVPNDLYHLPHLNG